MITRPSYWLQTIPASSIALEQWHPFTGSQLAAYAKAAQMATQPDIERVIVLDGSVEKGGCADLDQILADFSTTPMDGAKRMGHFI